MLDLRSGHPFDPEKQEATDTPAYIEAEQALLGIVLFDNSYLDTLEVDIRPEHFYEPFHARLFRTMSAEIRMGLACDPITLIESFRTDPAFQDLGGLRYLLDLIDRSPPGLNAPAYADAIVESFNLRELIRVGEMIAAQARGRMIHPETGRIAAAAIVEQAEQDLMQLGQGKSRQSEVVSIAEAAAAVIAYVDDRTMMVGVRTGLNPIDIKLGSLMPGDLMVLGGRPSMGKSALALSVALNVAAPQLADYINGVEPEPRVPKGVLEIHGEMAVNRKDGGQVARRHLANVGFGLFQRDFPTYRDLRDKKVSVDQRDMLTKAASNFRDVPLRSVKRTGMTLSQIRSLARRQFAEWRKQGIEPGLLTIDHGGLIRPDKRTSGRYEAQTEIAIGSKELADDLGVPVMVLIQLSRNIESRDDKRPQLSDLRDSGAWEENADIAAFVYRDAYYAAQEGEPDADDDAIAWGKWQDRVRSKTIEIIFGKVREGSAGGEARLWGDLGWNAIRSGEPDWARGGLV